MDAAVEHARRHLAGQSMVVLTGAGVSTDSGIPDYRGPGSPNRTPMTYGEFRSGEGARRRYWARSHLGWRHIAGAAPNAGHLALAEMERSGAVTCVITQNVDGLHQAAGSRAVVDLHGRIADVVCLSCGGRCGRRELHDRLAVLNPRFAVPAAADIGPDGDAMLDHVDDFRIASCPACGGILKPDVVFFGENVPAERVARCYALVDAAEALLVAGSSLTVMSGFRLVRHAYRAGKPIVIVNRGPTRGDDLASVKIDDGCSQVLERLAEAPIVA